MVACFLRGFFADLVTLFAVSAALASTAARPRASWRIALDDGCSRTGAMAGEAVEGKKESWWLQCGRNVREELRQVRGRRPEGSKRKRRKVKRL